MSHRVTEKMEISPNVFAWTGPHLEFRLTQPGTVSEKMALTWGQGSVGKVSVILVTFLCL